VDTRENEELGAGLPGLADQGQSMLLIEHDMGLVLGICDRVVVLEFGRVITEGPPEVVRGDPRVVAAYLGDGAPADGGAAQGAAGDDEIMATLADEQAEFVARPRKLRPGRARPGAGQSGSVNRGGRFSNSAATASAWFERPTRAPISFCSAAKPVSRSTRPARSSSRFAARMA
jgi:ABC-type sulfate/molybdate transport systems ATPase subunit